MQCLLSMVIIIIVCLIILTRSEKKINDIDVISLLFTYLSYEKHLCSMVVLLFLSPLLFGSMSISFKPQQNEILFHHTQLIVMSNNDTLSYSFSAENKEFISSSLSFKFLAKRDNYTISIGDITKDTRIMLLSGDIFSSSRSLYAHNDSINMQLGESQNTSIALSFPYETISFHPFIISHLLERIHI